MHIKILLSCSLLIVSLPSHAYIGPGLGAGALAAVAGILLSVLAAIFAVTYYPIKRVLKRRKAAKENMGQKTRVHKVVDEAEKSDQD